MALEESPDVANVLLRVTGARLEENRARRNPERARVGGYHDRFAMPIVHGCAGEHDARSDSSPVRSRRDLHPPPDAGRGPAVAEYGTAGHDDRVDTGTGGLG